MNTEIEAKFFDVDHDAEGDLTAVRFDDPLPEMMKLKGAL